MNLEIEKEGKFIEIASLRDQFAMSALNALMTNEKALEGLCIKAKEYNLENSDLLVAKIAYNMADAMLIVRNDKDYETLKSK